MIKRNKSYFVIATNDAERDWKPAELLKQYKSQSRVERGFRFLKDPEFFADSIFLSYKSQSRVERGFRFLKDPEFFADSIFLSRIGMEVTE